MRININMIGLGGAINMIGLGMIIKNYQLKITILI